MLRATMHALAEQTEPGRITHLPFEWPASARRLSARPEKTPPITRYLLRHPWHIPNLFAREVPVGHRGGAVRQPASVIAG